MVTWADARQWQPAILQGAVGPLNAEYNEFVACTDDLRGVNRPGGWSGTGAEAAMAAGNRIIDDAEELAAEMAALRRAMGDVGDAITGVQHGVLEADEVARVHHFTIGGDGAITDNGPPPDTPEDQCEAVEAERKTVAAELEERVKEVLRQADDIDNDFCAVLERIRSMHTIDSGANNNQTTSLAAAGDLGTVQGGLSILAPPPVDASPAQNAAWWATLSRNQQLTLIHDLPDIVGNRDGVKARDRSQANLNMVDRERARFATELDRLRREGGDEDEIQRLDERVKALDRINEMMHKKDGSLNPARFLLSLDMTGDHPKAAIANGDIDTAEHVAVFTPGMESTVAGRMPDYVNDMQGVQKSAQNLLLKQNMPGSVATVTWLGYEPSSFDHMGAAIEGLVTGDNAWDGGNKLAHFYEGINTSRPHDAHLTALGHSQGSLVTGAALDRDPTGVDDAVFFGSPGISETPGVFNTAGDLKLPEGHAYNLTADGDQIANLVPAFGRYGVGLEYMPGMNQLSTDADTSTGAPLTASHGHGEYLKAEQNGMDSTSKHNVAAIVAGLPKKAVWK